VIRAGADINVQDYSIRSPLYVAALHEKEEIMRLLIEDKATLDILDGRGNTALMFAIENLKYATSKLLLDKGTFMRMKTHDGYTEIHRDSIMGNRIMTEFLAELGADIDAGTPDNREPNVLAFSEPGGICIKVERGTNQRSLLYSRLPILYFIK